ncbi:single-stranded DNA-binding protein [Microbacterium sp. E-13]|uniref:single-stranded DNA-binding protein n=1 Tax=Microbacterium sp. E-13 TaxID=3404048 RepID=UPI003CF4812F
MSDRGDNITIVGNVATAPERKHTATGVPITTFRVASGLRRFDSETRTWSDSGTNWYTVSAFRSLADHAYKSLQTGDRVILMGRLRLREWDNGTRRGTAIEIDADAVGHDLRWGTSTFVRVARRDAAEDSKDRPGPDMGGHEDAWAAPGVEATAPLAESEDAVPELVGATVDGSTAAAGHEVPF